MADEIPLANVIRVERCAGIWWARIGPPALGIAFPGRHRRQAVKRLLEECDRCHWPWDETWVDRME